MSLKWTRRDGSGELLSVLVLRERGPATGAVGMWESRQRFPRAVESEGNLLLVFLTFHATVISTALRDCYLTRDPHPSSLAMPLSNRLFACCIAMAASVSECFCANSLSSPREMPGRRKLSHCGV